MCNAHPKPQVSYEPVRSPIDRFVKFTVGHEKTAKTFTVPRHVAEFYSPLLAAAFKSPMIEGQTQSMVLEDVDSEIFGMLVHWMYKQELEGEETIVCPMDCKCVRGAKHFLFRIEL
jgi:hypothetical protein